MRLEPNAPVVSESYRGEVIILREIEVLVSGEPGQTGTSPDQPATSALPDIVGTSAALTDGGQGKTVKMF